MNLTWHLMVSRVNQVLATLPQKLEIVKSTLSANQTRASLLHWARSGSRVWDDLSFAFELARVLSRQEVQ